MKLNNCRCFWCLPMAVVSKRHNIIYIVVSPSCTFFLWSFCNFDHVEWTTVYLSDRKTIFLSNNELRNDPNILYQVKHLIYFNAVHASSVSHFIWIEKAKTFEPPKFSFYLLATLRCLLLILLHTCSFSWSQVQWVGSSLTSYIHYLYELGKRGEIETQNV